MTTIEDPKLKMALNAAVDMHRLAQLRSGLLAPGSTPMDGKRGQVWCEYGWKEDLDFEDFHNAFRRSGIAHGAVRKIVQRCWRTEPWVIEGDPEDNAEKVTPWERKFKGVMKPSRMWRAWSRADEMRLVGGWSGLILHIRDNLKWQEPATPGRGLEGMTAVWASSLAPLDVNRDETNERFGLPEFWQYTSKSDSSSGTKQVKIHWSRIFIVGDPNGTMPAFLEPAYNSLTNIEKVEGGSGESFLKNASRQLNFNFDPQLNLNQIAEAYGVPLKDLQTVYDKVTRAVNQGVDATVITQGATVTPLTTTVPDPKPTYDINIQTIAAALDIPAKVLVGNQTGERASTEDNEYFDERCQSRREDELRFDIEEFVERLVELKLIKLPAKGYTVMWDDLTESSPTGKLTLAKLMADANATSMGEPYFTTDEVRAAASYDPLEEPLGDDVDAEDPEEEEDDDVA